MRLDELLGVKKFANMTRDEIGMWAEKHGPWKKVGQGGHSHVYERDGEVYKFWFADNAYDMWVDYCIKNQGNKFLPRFKSKVKSIPAAFLRHLTTPERIKYVKMEKLSKIDWNNNMVQIFKDEKLPKVRFADALDALYSDKDANGARECEKLIIDTAEKEANHISQSARDDGEDADDVNLKDARIDHPDGKMLLDVIVNLQQLMAKNEFTLDISQANLAQRGDVPVVLDPVADIEGSGKRNYFWNNFEAHLNQLPRYRASDDAKNNTVAGDEWKKRNAKK